MRITNAALCLGLMTSVTSATVLTKSNFDATTSGKTVFIKFYAPWCGHCKGMKPAWDDLMKEYEDHASIVIGDVDCTSDESKALCQEHGVQGYPTIKYGDPLSLEDYKGGRDLDALQSHAKTLGPSCGPTNLDLCSDEKKAEIQKVMEESVEDLEKYVEEKEKELETLEETFKSEVEKLQTAYQKLTSDKEEGIKNVKAGGLSLRKQCLAAKKKAAEEGAEEAKEEL